MFLPTLVDLRPTALSHRQHRTTKAWRATTSPFRPHCFRETSRYLKTSTAMRACVHAGRCTCMACWVVPRPAYAECMQRQLVHTRSVHVNGNGQPGDPAPLLENAIDAQRCPSLGVFEGRFQARLPSCGIHVWQKLVIFPSRTLVRAATEPSLGHAACLEGRSAMLSLVGTRSIHALQWSFANVVHNP